MSIINEKMNANKPQVVEQKGKLAPGAINNNKDLDVEAKKEEPGFFGSFWKPGAVPKKKGGVSTMEAVSDVREILFTVMIQLTFL